MPKLFKARLTDCGRMRAEDVKPSVKPVHVTPIVKPVVKPGVKPGVKPPVKPVATAVRDNMARTTRVATFFGAQYSASRDGDGLNVYVESGDEVTQRALAATFWGRAFLSEIEGDELSIILVSDEVVATNTLGDKIDTKMSAARFQKTIISKVRRLAGVSR